MTSNSYLPMIPSSFHPFRATRLSQVSAGASMSWEVVAGGAPPLHSADSAARLYYHLLCSSAPLAQQLLSSKQHTVEKSPLCIFPYFLRTLLPYWFFMFSWMSHAFILACHSLTVLPMSLKAETCPPIWALPRLLAVSTMHIAIIT